MLILYLYNKTYIAIQKFDVVKIFYVFEKKSWLHIFVETIIPKRTAFILNRNLKDDACLYCWFW